MRDARGTIRTIRKTAAMVVMTLAGLSMLAADTLSDGILFRFAVTAWLIAATTYAIPRTGVTAGQLAAARDSGYDAGNADGYQCGFEDGRKFVRPALIHSDSVRPKPLTLGSTAHQLGE